MTKNKDPHETVTMMGAGEAKKAQRRKLKMATQASLDEFCKETTFHGLRYTTDPSSTFFRRILWVLVVLTSLIIFVYFIGKRVSYWTSHPRAVDVDIEFVNSLPFPAITVCNENTFRLSKLYELGQYYKFEKDPTDGWAIPDHDEDKACEYDLHLQEGRIFAVNINVSNFISLDDEYESNANNFLLHVRFRNISLRTCHKMCLGSFSSEVSCEALIYNHTDKNCYLSNMSPGQHTTTLLSNETDTFTRDAYCSQKVKTCTSGRGCMFSVNGSRSSTWNLWPPNPRYGPRHGRWYRSNGKILTLSKSASKTEAAVVYSAYMAPAEPRCLEFYYHLSGPEPQGKIQVVRENSDGRQILWQKSETTNEMWDASLVKIYTEQKPYRILIEGFTSGKDLSSVALDGLRFGHCSFFEENCHKSGQTYMGNVSESATGKTCIPWSHVVLPFIYPQLYFPDGSLIAAGNMCRTPTRYAEKPFCLFRDEHGAYGVEECNIPKCECTKYQFQCKSGMCISKEFQCDGFNDCADGTDERTECVWNVTCDFEPSNKCGYKNATTWRPSTGAFWAVHDDTARPEFTKVNKTSKPTDNFLVLDLKDSEYMPGQLVSVASPIIDTAVNKPTLLTFSAIISLVKGVPGNTSSLFIYQYFGDYDKKLIASIGVEEKREWNTYAYVMPTAARPFGILFEAVVGIGADIDMAIDDVLLEDGDDNISHGCRGDMFQCTRSKDCLPKTVLCNGYNDCTDFSDESEEHCSSQMTLVCDFEDNFMCGYVDDSNPWIISDSWRWNGDINAVETNVPSMTPYALKKLESPWTKANEECIKISYTFLADDPYCTLSIYTETPKRRFLALVIGHYWNITKGQAHIFFDYWEDKARLSFEVNCTSYSSILVQIHQVSLDSEQCFRQEKGPALDECNFEAGSLCDLYSDRSVEKANWLLIDKEPFGSVYWDVDVADMKGLALLSTMTQWSGGTLSSRLFTTSSETCYEFTYMFTDEYQKSQGYNLSLSIKDHYTHRLWPIERESNGTSRIKLKEGEHKFIIKADIKGRMDWFARQYVYFIMKKIAVVNMALCNVTTPEKDQDYNPYRMGCEGVYNYTSCDGVRDCPQGEDEKEDFCAMIREQSKKFLIDQVPWTAEVAEVALPRQSNRPSENLTELYYSAGHQIEDMLISCSWDGEECYKENFTTHITDQGLCYTFNLDEPHLHATKTGASSGLHLVLNIEQYEYTKSRHGSAGAKILLHDQREVPFVGDMGFSVGPGMHALVRTSRTKVTKLAPPWGNCGTRHLKYYGEDSYTYSACTRECQSNETLDTCGCIDSYMPHHPEETSVCSISEFLQCNDDTEWNFEDVCNCTEPCVKWNFDSQLSYASLSPNLVNNEKSLRNKRSGVKEKFVVLRARTDKYALSGIIYYLSLIQRKLSDLLGTTQPTEARPEQWIFSQIKTAAGKFNDVMLQDIANMIVKRKRMQQSRKRDLNTKFNIFTTITKEIYIDIIHYDHLINSTVKDPYKFITTDSLLLLTHRMDTAMNFLEDIEKIKSGDIDYDVPLRCLAYLNKRLDTQLTSVREGLSDASRLSANSRIQLTTMIKNISTLMTSAMTTISHTGRCIDDYEDTVSRMYVVNRDTYITEHMSTFNFDTHLNAIKHFDKDKRLTQMAIRYANYMDQLRKGHLSSFVLSRMCKYDKDTFMSEVEKSLAHIQTKGTDPLFTYFGILRTNMIKRYNTLFSSEHNQMTTAMKWTREFTGINDLDIWKNLKLEFGLEGVELIKEKVKLHVKDYSAFYRREGPARVEATVDQCISHMDRKVNDILDDLLLIKNYIISLFDNCIKESDKFQDMKIIDDYVTNNILAANIYYAELKQQVISQNPAYDEGAFFSDVGGFMGLLLGGSLITVFEMIDFLCIKTCRKWTKRDKRI